MFDHRSSFEKLVSTRNGLAVHSINFVENHIFDLEPKQQLASIGLGDHAPIYFSVGNTPYCKNSTLSQNGGYMRGCVINSIIEGEVQQIVLIQESVENRPELDEDLQLEWSYMMKLAALAHELGHVEDMQKTVGSNFDFTGKPRVDLVKAEAYAHSYCLNYLNKIGATIARNTIAGALLRMSVATKKFEVALYQELCGKLGKGRLKKWSKA
ncbi:hypothetical protein [Vibrio maritimus]|uniref:hypothetical protein n=1 Tax=Vibrio maritimus TaxID=990268 RepID=UPI003736BE56